MTDNFEHLICDREAKIINNIEFLLSDLSIITVMMKGAAKHARDNCNEHIKDPSGLLHLHEQHAIMNEIMLKLEDQFAELESE